MPPSALPVRHARPVPTNAVSDASWLRSAIVPRLRQLARYRRESPSGQDFRPGHRAEPMHLRSRGRERAALAGGIDTTPLVFKPAEQPHRTTLNTETSHNRLIFPDVKRIGRWWKPAATLLIVAGAAVLAAETAAPFARASLALWRRGLPLTDYASAVHVASRSDDVELLALLRAAGADLARPECRRRHRAAYRRGSWRPARRSLPRRQWRRRRRSRDVRVRRCLSPWRKVTSKWRGCCSHTAPMPAS